MVINCFAVLSKSMSFLISSFSIAFCNIAHHMPVSLFLLTENLLFKSGKYCAICKIMEIYAFVGFVCDNSSVTKLKLSIVRAIPSIYESTKSLKLATPLRQTLFVKSCFSII